MPNNIVVSKPGGTIIRLGNGAATPYLTLSGVATTGTVGVATSGLVTNPGAASATWSVVSSPADVLVSPSSGTLSAGAAVAFTLTALASGLKNISLSSTTPDTVVSGSPMPITMAPAPTPTPPPPPPPASATTLTLSVASTGTTGSSTLVTVTPNAAIASSGTATLAVSGGGTLGAATLNFTAGSSAAQSTTITRSTDGTSTLTLTNSMGLANAGTPAAYSSSSATSTGTPQPFTLTSASSGALPFAIGYAMSQGHVPSGQSLTFAGATAKLTILSTWPDGSARHGVIAGTYTSAGSAVTVTPTVASVLPGTPLTGAAVQTAMGANTAVFDAGAFGSATFSGSDFASPFITHAATDGFIEAIYRKQIGADAHLVAWLALRVWSSGAVEALPWVENGYLNVSGPTNKNDTYSFTFGGTSRFSAAVDLKHHQRTPLVSGSLLSHWLGTDPGVVPLHSAAYLQATELVPSYYSSLSAGHARVLALPSTYTPLQQGSFDYTSDAMTSSGYQRPIGLLPEHDVLHLVAADADRAATFKAVVRNGYSAGRYPIHYRDEATNKPLKFSDHPTRVIADGSGFSSNGTSTTSTRTPTVSGTAPPVWDTAHSPSVGYMAYLLTGWRYFLEEVQFAATCNYLGNGDNSSLRNGSQGLVQTAVDAWQTRASAWDWRTHAQALAITPSTDHIYAELLNRAHSNVDHFHGRYVAQANNAFGLILPGETYSASISRVAVWQQDMVTAAWGYSKSLGLPLDVARTAKIGAFFEWKAQSVIGRLGTSGTFPFENANRYTIELGTVLSSSGYTAGTGPWPASWTAIYGTTTPLASSPDNPLATAGGNVLATEYDATSAAKGQWGTMQMAIAYAVRHAVNGASAAYERMIGATNWASMLTANFAASFPVMGVKPYVQSTPAWASAVAVGQIKAVGGTGAGGAAVDAFNGWAYRPDTGELFIAAAGGHNDSFDNRVVSCDLMAASLSWTLRKASTGSGSVLDQEYQADGTPSSRHNYQETRWVAAQNRVMLFGCYAPYGPGVTTQDAVDGFNPDTNAWDAAGTWPNITAGYYARSQEGTGDVWSLPGNGLARKFTASTGAFSSPSINSVGSGVRFPWAWDGTAMYGLCWADGQGFGSGVNSIKHVGTTQTAITFNSSGAYTQFQSDAPQYAGMDYCSTDGKFYFYDGRGSTAGRIFTITPNGGTTWDMGTFTAGSGSDTLPATVSAGLQNRWTFVTVGTAKGFLFMPSASAGLYFLRTE